MLNLQSRTIAEKNQIAYPNINVWVLYYVVKFNDLHEVPNIIQLKYITNLALETLMLYVKTIIYKYHYDIILAFKKMYILIALFT